MFDGWCSLLMQYNLSMACLLASIQQTVNDGQFVSSNLFPVPDEHWRLFYTFLFPFFLCLSLVLPLSSSFFLSFSHSLPLDLFLHFTRFVFFFLTLLQSCHILFLVASLWSVYASSGCIAHFSIDTLSVLFLSYLLFLCFPVTTMFVYHLLCHSHHMSTHHLVNFSIATSSSCFLYSSLVPPLSLSCPDHRIISKMPGIFLTVWQFWAASLTFWLPSLG